MLILFLLGYYITSKPFALHVVGRLTETDFSAVNVMFHSNCVFLVIDEMCLN